MDNNNRKLVLSEVWKKYAEIEAVKGISFDVMDEEFLSILGPSGCGKTSTLRMIAGLEEITAGDMFLDGKRINGVPPRERSVALAFENYALYPNFTVAGNLAFPLKAQGWSKKDIEDKVMAVIGYLGLGKCKDMKPAGLSGGDLQRAALGRALIREASIYLFDEALSHLDPREKEDVRAQLLRIHKVNASTYILVTHDQSEAVAMSDRIVVMREGEIQQVGSPEDLYTRPTNLFVADFIGEPPINLLKGLFIRNAEEFKLKCETVEFPLPNQVAKAWPIYGNKEIVLGIYPRYVHICDKTKPNSVVGIVHSYQYLGEMGILILNCKGEEVVLELEHKVYYQLGEEVSICFSDEHINIFDPETTERISYLVDD